LSAAAVYALSGPTASGKTGLALAWAQARGDVEIISVDSALIYRDMDIGTAKPSAAELASLPHHLINTHDAAQSYSAADFARDAHRLVAEIRARGRTPLLVGGTMLYFKALLDGLQDMPPANAAVRADIDAQAAALGWPAVHAELAKVDAASAARLAPHDSQRIQRALEVYRLTGQALSVFHAQAPLLLPPLPLRLLSLEAQDKIWLHQRIAQRTALMLQQGLVEEVQALKNRGNLHLNLPSMRCVGYRQTWHMLDGEFAAAELAERISIATRQLAKRQMTWLRSMPTRRVLPAETAQVDDLHAFLP
jgi:tRNA dimethylallyltransferase